MWGQWYHWCNDANIGIRSLYIDFLAGWVVRLTLPLDGTDFSIHSLKISFHQPLLLVNIIVVVVMMIFLLVISFITHTT